MNDIGHFEFGELHRPIWFDGVDEVLNRDSTDSLNYWIGYWVQALRHLVRFKEDVIFVSYENLCLKGSPALLAIAQRLGLEVTHLRMCSRLSSAPRLTIAKRRRRWIKIS